MAVPSDRSTFKEYCLRKLGKPVIEINVSDEQVEDRIDEALRYYCDFHFEGTDKTYFKYQITSNNYATHVYGLLLNVGGSGYSNSDVLSFAGNGTGAAGTIQTNSNGAITSVSLANNGSGYGTAPTVSVVTAGGSGANITCELGGWVPVPENIIGVVNLFDVGVAASASNLFNLRYQIVIADMFMFNNMNVVPFYTTMQNVDMIEEILMGKQPIRYNRNKNRLYIDMDWSMLTVGSFLIAEAYEVIDPTVYTDVWKEGWLQRYASTLIKEQWGSILKKMNVPLIGGITYNGQAIYDEAIKERAELEYAMINTYSLPSTMLVG